MRILLLILFTITATAQEFKIENENLIWQNVIDSKQSITEVGDELKLSGNFENIEILNGVILADIIEAPIKNGNKSGQPIYITASNLSGKVVIEFKVDKRRVTVKNLMLNGNVPNLAIATGLQTLETYATKGNEFKKRFLRKDIHTFNDHIKGLFEYNLDNW